MSPLETFETNPLVDEHLALKHSFVEVRKYEIVLRIDKNLSAAGFPQE